MAAPAIDLFLVIIVQTGCINSSIQDMLFLWHREKRSILYSSGVGSGQPAVHRVYKAYCRVVIFTTCLSLFGGPENYTSQERYVFSFYSFRLYKFVFEYHLCEALLIIYSHYTMFMTSEFWCLNYKLILTFTLQELLGGTKIIINVK